MARKAKHIHYIYKTICNVTGKWYIGMHSTSNINDGYLGSGVILRHSIRKYGKDNHTKEILEYLESREALILREIEIVTKEIVSDGLCMNLKEGGTGGFANEEHMMKCSKAGNDARSLKLATDLEYRESYAANISLKIKKLYENGEKENPNKGHWKGKNHSEESKHLIGEKMKGSGTGEANSQYGSCWITKDDSNKKIKKEDLDTYLLEGWVRGRR